MGHLKAMLIHRSFQINAWSTPENNSLTNDNPLSDLHSRKRAPLKQLRRCFENLTGNESSMSETPDEEVDYGSCGSSANPPTDSDHTWSTSEKDSQD